MKKRYINEEISNLKALSSKEAMVDKRNKRRTTKEEKPTMVGIYSFWAFTCLKTHNVTLFPNFSNS